MVDRNGALGVAYGVLFIVKWQKIKIMPNVFYVFFGVDKFLQLAVVAVLFDIDIGVAAMRALLIVGEPLLETRNVGAALAAVKVEFSVAHSSINY